MTDQIEIKASTAVVSGRARGGRPTQQDDLICLHDAEHHTQLVVLADGMGGHGAGELASRLVIETAKQLWNEGRWKEQPGAMFLEAICQQSHAELLASRDPHTQAQPHATVVALMIKPDHVSWAHVGDSRVYRFRGSRFLGCTQDHSVAQRNIRLADTDTAALDLGDRQHMLLQGLGGDKVPVVEHGWMPTQPGLRFVLCTDGVWTQLSVEELHVFVRRPDHDLALQQALALALERGGEQGDNASLIFVGVDSAPTIRERMMCKWSALTSRNK